jgi:hypothetical protein
MLTLAKTAVALAISIFGFVGAYYSLTGLVGVEDEVAGSISGLSFGLFVHIDQWLKKGRFSLWHPAWPTDIVPLERYAIPWYLLILYGAMVLLCVTTIPLAAIIKLSRWVLEQSLVWPIVDIIFPTITLLTAYTIGYWAGTRVDKLGPIVVLTIIFLWLAVFTTIEYQIFGFRPSLDLEFAILLLLITMIMMVGLWRGRKKRMATYLNYLLSRLSNGDQKELLSMVYESTSRRAAFVAIYGDQKNTQ